MKEKREKNRERMKDEEITRGTAGRERETDEDRESREKSGRERTRYEGGGGKRKKRDEVKKMIRKGQMDKERRVGKRYRNGKGEEKRKRAAHTVHMRDRPSAYEAAGIDQPKSATTPGVLLRALLFSARRGTKRSGTDGRRRRMSREVDA